MKKATFGAGCFWGVEKKFLNLKGVVSTTVGYTGGKKENPTYRDVCSGDTGHTEVLEIEFDSNIVTYKTLVENFFSIHDPTQINAQGPDIGFQYRSVIFYHSEDQLQIANQTIQELTDKNIHNKPIATQVEPATTFYRAEEYHQKYFLKNR